MLLFETIQRKCQSEWILDLWFLLGVRRLVKHKAGVQTDPCLIGRENAGDCFDIVGPLNGKLIIQSLLAYASLTEHVCIHDPTYRTASPCLFPPHHPCLH